MLKGPLVGELQSTLDLVEEYANGIPAYKIKTAVSQRLVGRWYAAVYF